MVSCVDDIDERVELWFLEPVEDINGAIHVKCKMLKQTIYSIVNENFNHQTRNSCSVLER